MTDGDPLAASPSQGPVNRADRMKRRATYAAVGVAVTLILFKTVAWLVTGSVSLLSTLIDSMLDLAASMINLFAVRQATTPADREHRFGHGKAEPLAGLVQAAFVTGSAAFLLFEAGGRLVNPVPVVRSEVGIAVMVVAIALTLGLVLYQRSVVRHTGSVAIGADSLHYSADLLVNLCVIVALLLSSQLGWTLADPLFAIGIAVLILRGAWAILRDSMNLLMDRELPDEERQHIRDIALSHPRVLDMHDLRTRSTGSQLFIQMHLEMEGGMSLREAHDVADAVMESVERVYPNAEVLIHQDPHGVQERRARFG